METKSERPAVRPQSSKPQQSHSPEQSSGRRPSAPGSSAANTTSFGRNQARYRVPNGTITPQFHGLTARPRTRSVVRLEELEKEKPKVTQPSAKSIQVPGEGGNPADGVAPARWQPSVSIGSPLWLEGEDPSRIEIADRNITQKRLWVEQYRGIHEFTRLLDEAIGERDQLDENNVENTMPQYVFPSLSKLYPP